MLSSIILFIIFISFGFGSEVSVKVNSGCPTREPGIDNDDPKVTLVTSHPSIEFPKLYSIVQINCTAGYPIEWEFDSHPHITELEQSLEASSEIGSHMNWNTSYIRDAYSVFQEASQHFNTTLSFHQISIAQLEHFGIRCQNVKDPCQSTFAKSIVAELVLKNINKSSSSIIPQEISPASFLEGNCTLSLWFDEYSQLFYCKGREPNVVPKMSFRYCANPTECGLSNVKHFGENDCDDAPSSRTHKRKCSKADNSCRDLSVGTEFPIPKVISCWDKYEGRLWNSSVKLMGYFHSIKEVDGRPASSYINWDEADPEDLVSIEGSKQKVMANESFDIACHASYYYFAMGMHLTFKHMSDPTFTETDVVLLPLYNLPTIEETLEVWNHTKDNNASSDSPQGVPLKRNLLAQNFLLPAGDYEFTCYAPIWNNTEWVTKTLLITVSNISLPTFVTGNLTQNIDFTSRKNMTCLGKGIPPPKITWQIDDDEFASTIMLTNGQTKAMSWSVLTLPDTIEKFQYTLKCRAENPGGFDEKLYILRKDGEHVAMSTKIAAFVVVIGFIGNLIVGYFCWKYLFAEDEQEMAAVTFLRNLLHGKVGCFKNHRSGDEMTTEDLKACDHPKCRQQMTQTP